METVDHHHIFPNGYVAKNPLNLLLVADNITNIMMASFSCPRSCAKITTYICTYMPLFVATPILRWIIVQNVRPRSNISSYTICMQQ